MDANPALQQWLETLDWAYDENRRIHCQGCGRSFAQYGIRTRCRPCAETCEHLEAACLFGAVVARSGIRQPRKLCLICGLMIPTRRGSPTTYTFRDNRDDRTPSCVRCGSTNGTENHHWAPTAIFGYAEAERWPRSPLCPSCHRTWHRQMRLASGYSLPTEQRIDDDPWSIPALQPLGRRG